LGVRRASGGADDRCRRDADRCAFGERGRGRVKGGYGYERRGALLVRHGKGDKRREVGMDDWGFEHYADVLFAAPWLEMGDLDGPRG